MATGPRWWDGCVEVSDGEFNRGSVWTAFVMSMGAARTPRVCVCVCYRDKRMEMHGQPYTQNKHTEMNPLLVRMNPLKMCERKEKRRRGRRGGYREEGVAKTEGLKAGGWGGARYLLVIFFGGQSFLQLLLCVGVESRAVWRPDVIMLLHPWTQREKRSLSGFQLMLSVRVSWHARWSVSPLCWIYFTYMTGTEPMGGKKGRRYL